MWFLLGAALWTASLAAQSLQLTPAKPRQGDAIRVTAPAGATTARMNGRVTQLFPDGGSSFGLMPVPVLEKPGTYKLEVLDAKGLPMASSAVVVRNARFRRQNVSLAPSITALKPSPGEMQRVREFRTTVSDERHWQEPFQRPLPGCQTSPFGVLRYHNGKPTGGFHGGVDQRGPEGDPIRAVADGVARLVRMFNIHGGTVGIDHGQGLVSIYLHMSKFAVEEGAPVKKGDVIGYVGSTGRSNAPHLHWGLYAHGVAVNPLQWVKLQPCAPPAKKPPRRR